MTRCGYRILAPLLALVLLTAGAVAGGSVVLGVGPGQMVSVPGGWKDPNCGTANQTYDLRLFRDIDYGGGVFWRFCSGGWQDLCWAPYGNDSSDAALCALGFDAGTANDKASSLKVISVSGASSCHVSVYGAPNYTGGVESWWDPINVPSLVPWPHDDISSLRRVC